MAMVAVKYPGLFGQIYSFCLSLPDELIEIRGHLPKSVKANC